jgi:hypothetical protein
MSNSENRASAKIVGLYFPRIRKHAKRLMLPRAQALLCIGDVSFGVELQAPLEGLKYFQKLSLPMLGNIFQELTEKMIQHASLQPKSGRVRARSKEDVSVYDCAIKTAKLIGPSLWQWLKSSPQNVSRSANRLSLVDGSTAKEVLAGLLQKNWESENGRWPGANPTDDPEAFFRKLNKYQRLDHGYSLLSLPTADQMVNAILNGKSYCYRLMNGYCCPPESVLPPIYKES